MMAAKTDLDLLEAFRRHQDQQAFATLVERHAGWVYGLCLRVTGRAIEAEEASSDAFFELARCADRVGGRLPAWLHTVAHRQAIRVIGRRPASALPGWDVAAVPSQRADLEHLDEALDELTAELRAVLVLRFLANASQEQVAAQLGLSQPTVSRRISEALAAMRAALDRRGASLGIAPTALFGQLPCASLPGHALDTLRRVALVVRPLTAATPGAWSSAGPILACGVLALAVIAWWSGWQRSWPAPAPVPAAALVASGGSTPATADQPDAPPRALLGWTDRIVHIDAADPALRHAVGAARTIIAVDGQPIARYEQPNRPVPADDRATLTVLDPDGTARRIPEVHTAHLVTVLDWDPKGGVARGAWDADVARAAAHWRDQPESALAAVAAAVADGCAPGELSVLACAAAAQADRPDAVAQWYARIPPARLDRWMGDLALHLALRAHGRLREARIPLANLGQGLGRLAAELPDAPAPRFPSAWHPLMDLGPDFSFGSAHIWDALRTDQMTAALGPELAVEARGDVFTAVPGLARSQDLSGIYLSPVFADGHHADIRDCVGVLMMDSCVSHVCDGSGALIPCAPGGSGALDVRLLVTSDSCAVWMDGRLCGLAPQRHHGAWRLVLSGTSCDIYLPHLRITSPSAPLRDDLPSAIVADDPLAVRRRLDAGDDPHRPFPGSNEAPMSIAASADCIQAITALLGDPRVTASDIDQTQASALYRAVDNHAINAARLLAGHGAAISPINRYGTTPLGYACRSRNQALVALLLEHGALTTIDRPNGTGPEPALDLMSPGRGAQAVIAAFQSRHLPLTPRSLAIAGDDAAALAALAAEPDQGVRASSGAALLAAAVLLDDQALLERCLQAGIPVGARDPSTGMTAIQLAIVFTGNCDLARVLMAHGADPAASCHYGSMADLAGQNGFPLAQLRASAPPPTRGF